MRDIPEHVVLEGECVIEDGAVLGHVTGRTIPSLALCIGNGAIIRSGTVIYVGSTIGPGLETGHNVVIREENIIGAHCCIWSNSVVDYGCRLGNHVKIHANVYVAQFTIIQDHVFLAPGVIIANDPTRNVASVPENEPP